MMEVHSAYTCFDCLLCSRDNYVSLKIFYGELSFESITQTPAYTWVNFFSEYYAVFVLCSSKFYETHSQRGDSEDTSLKRSYNFIYMHFERQNLLRKLYEMFEKLD